MSIHSMVRIDRLNQRLAEIEAAAKRYEHLGFPQEIPDLTYTLRRAVDLLRYRDPYHADVTAFLEEIDNA